MLLPCIEVKRFEESMFSCIKREVACQEVVRQGMLLKVTEFFYSLQIILYYFHSIACPVLR